MPTPAEGSPRWGLAAAVLAAFLLLGTAAFMITGRNTITTTITTGGSSAKSAEIIAAAEKLRLQAEPDKSEVILRAAAAEYATDQPLQIALGELLVEKASRMTTDEAADAARRDAYAAYERALAIGPRDAKLEFVAGTLASKLSNLQRAVEHYSAAQAADATEARYPLYLAQVQLRLNQDAEAKANLLIAAKLSPDTANVWGTLADVALRENKLSIALQHIRRARELEPRNVLWRVVEARALKRDNKPEEALALLIGLDDADRLEPNVTQILAESLGMLGRNGEAADAYEAASAANPADGPLALEAARWLEAAGRRDKARDRAEHAAMLATPGAREVADRLK
ncbi:MAG: hypothetical protein ACOYN0_07010 [Phycisphaerales bacterium]